MAMLTEDQWHDLIITACNDDGSVETQWDTIWEARAGLDDVDGSGYLRYYAVLRDAFDILLGPSTDDINTSDGGGQSEEAATHFDHLRTQRKQADDDFIRQLHALTLDTGLQVAVMAAYSLTPMFPGVTVPDPASPYYLGDPRYNSLLGWYYGPGRVQ